MWIGPEDAGTKHSHLHCKAQPGTIKANVGRMMIPFYLMEDTLLKTREKCGRSSSPNISSKHLKRIVAMGLNGLNNRKMIRRMVMVMVVMVMVVMMMMMTTGFCVHASFQSVACNPSSCFHLLSVSLGSLESDPDVIARPCYAKNGSTGTSTRHYPSPFQQTHLKNKIPRNVNVAGGSFCFNPFDSHRHNHPKRKYLHSFLHEVSDGGEWLQKKLQGGTATTMQSSNKSRKTKSQTLMDSFFCLGFSWCS